MKTLLCLSLACVCAPALLAQLPPPAPTPMPPGEPFLDRAPAFSQWTITSETAIPEITNDPQKASASPSPDETASTPTPAPSSKARGKSRKQPKTEQAPLTSVAPATSPAKRTTVVTKTKEMRYERASGGESGSVERWWAPGIQITIQGEGSPVVSLPNNAGTSNYMDYSKNDFDGFEWISSRNYRGTDTVNDQECYVFRDKVKNPDGDPDAPSERVACINTATRMPVTLQIADELSTYRFELAPTAMLKPPAQVASRMEQWKQSIEQTTLRPATP